MKRSIEIMSVFALHDNLAWAACLVVNELPEHVALDIIREINSAPVGIRLTDISVKYSSKTNKHSSRH